MKRDPIELLIESNPVGTYEVDLAAVTRMVNRISHTSAPRAAWWRTWQTRVVAVAASVTLVVSGTATILAGGGSAFTGVTQSLAQVPTGEGLVTPVTPKPAASTNATTSGVSATGSRRHQSSPFLGFEQFCATRTPTGTVSFNATATRLELRVALQGLPAVSTGQLLLTWVTATTKAVVAGFTSTSQGQVTPGSVVLRTVPMTRARRLELVASSSPSTVFAILRPCP